MVAAISNENNIVDIVSLPRGTVLVPPRALHRRRVGVLFCGAGIGSFGWGRDPKMRLAWGSDKEAELLEFFSANHEGVRTFEADLGVEAATTDLLNTADDVDLLQVSPPCQWCSWAGRRDPQDARARLSVAWAWGMLQARYLPPVIMIEQVQAFAVTDVWSELQWVLRRHYDLQSAMVDASYLFAGNQAAQCCQRRVRLISVAVLRGSGVRCDFEERVARAHAGKRTTVEMVFPDMECWWHFARRQYQPCVLSVRGQVPPVRRNAHYFPAAGRYQPRPGDVGTVGQCRELSLKEWGQVMGVSEVLHLPTSKAKAMLALANGFVPSVAQLVAQTLRWPEQRCEERAEAAARRIGGARGARTAVRRGPVKERAMRLALALLRARALESRAGRIEKYWALAGRALSQVLFSRRWIPSTSAQEAHEAAHAAEQAAREVVLQWGEDTGEEGVGEATEVRGAALQALWQSQAEEAVQWEPADSRHTVQGGLRVQTHVDLTQSVPEWFWDTAAGRERQLPQDRPSQARRQAAEAAARAAHAADVAFALAELARVGAEAATPTAGQVGAQEAALVAAHVAGFAKRAAEEAALHGFFDSGCFEKFALAFGEGPDPLQAIDELHARAGEGQWQVEQVALELKAEKEERKGAALNSIEALEGATEERWRRRWESVPERLQPGCGFLAEARLRLAGGVAASGLPARPVGGRFCKFTAEWRRMTDDEEVLRWVTPVEEGGGVDFEPSDDFEQCNSAVNASGERRANDGNGDGVTENEEFVAHTIEEMIESGVARHLGPIGHPDTVVPDAVCPLGCAPKSNGKLRLYHDARKPNEFIDAGTMNLETLSRMRHTFKRNGYMILADASAAYWHMALTWRSSMLCGFAFAGQYFVWLVLPFGICSAPRIYVKLALVVFTHWRRSCPEPYEARKGAGRGGARQGGLVAGGRSVRQRRRGWPEVVDNAHDGAGMEGISYIDDVALVPPSLRLGRWWAVVALLDMVRLGFSLSWRKCQFEPVQEGKVLGVWVDLIEFVFRVMDKQVEAIKELCQLAQATARAGDEMRTRTLARLCGKVMSCYLAVGDPVYVMTKYTYATIARATGTPPDATRRELKAAWNSFTAVPPEVVEEARFWEEMIGTVKGVEIAPSKVPARLVQVMGADTGDMATGGYLLDHNGNQLLEVVVPLEAGESTWSSTKREVRGLRRVMEAMEGKVERPIVQPLMDTQCGVRALVRGSTNPEIHEEAVEVMKLAMRMQVRLRPAWLPREMAEIKVSDGLGKEEEERRARQDLQLDPKVFAQISEAWGPLTIDLFADAGNAQLRRFYSRHFSLGCEDADAFAHDWSGEMAWANPPHCLVAQTLHHASVVCKARLVLLVPRWTEAPWWPAVSTGKAVVETRRIRARRGLVRSQAGSRPLRPTEHDLVAVLLDFSESARRPRQRRARKRRRGGREQATPTRGAAPERNSAVREPAALSAGHICGGQSL